MAWVCAEPSRFRTSGNSDERFHVQRDVRHARTSHRTSRNGTGKSAWHSSNANPARRAGQILPATPGSVVAHSSAGNARVRVSPSAHRTRRRQRQYLRLRPGDCTSQPTRIGDVLLVVTGRTRPKAVTQVTGCWRLLSNPLQTDALSSYSPMGFFLNTTRPL
jgi:hypothetical protein